MGGRSESLRGEARAEGHLALSQKDLYFTQRVGHQCNLPIPFFRQDHRLNYGKRFP